MKKWKITGAVALVIIVGAVIFWLHHDRHREFTGVQEDVSSETEAAKPKTLKLLMHSPDGDQVPIDTDGITVMFNQAMVPLTTLSEGQQQAIPLQITPAIDGTYHWLGTHAFIFRPSKPLAPATRYHVTLPGPFTSVEGLTLPGPVSWDFTTVRPKVLRWTPSGSSTLLPQKAVVRLKFNMSMDRSDVTRKLSATVDDKKIPVQLTWEDGDHIVNIIFGKSLPWDAEVKLSLAEGAKSKYGNVGTAAVSDAVYSTPSRTFELNSVEVRPTSGYAKPYKLTEGKRTDATLGASICFNMGAPLKRAVFEKALKVTGGPGDQPLKARVYAYATEQYAYVGKDNRIQYVSGYTELCVDALKDYFKEYRFTIDPKGITAVTGATFTGKGETYIVQTPHAKPSLVSNVTKNIVMAAGPQTAGPMKLPYTVANLDKLQVRIYPFPDPAYFSEDIRNEHLAIHKKYDQTLKMYLDEPLADTLELPGNYTLILDPKTHAIKTSTLKPLLTHDIPVTAATDTEFKLMVDLAHLGDAKPPKPGLYLVEAIGTPRKGGEAPFPVYTAVQVTPVAIAMKDDVDRMVVWVTDIVTGAPVADLPLESIRVESDGNKSNWSVTTESRTNADGVAIITNSSQCIQVADPARYSLTCKDWHRLNQHRMMNTSWNYYAYVYTDRPIYRPGQPVYFSSIIRHVQEGRYFQPMDSDGKSIKADVAVLDAEGANIYERKEVAIDKAGVVSGTFTLDPSEKTPRGAYELSVTVEGQSFTRKFYVASYRKPAFKVDLSSVQKEIVNTDTLAATVSAHYLFGMPMGKAGLTWSIMTSTYDFRPEGYEGFSFVDPDLVQKMMDQEGNTHYESEYEYDEIDSSDGHGIPEDASQVEDPKKKGSTREPDGFFKGPDGKENKNLKNVLDATGHFKLTTQPDLKKYPTSQVLTIEASVEDLSHQQVSASEDVVAHKADLYVGLRPQKWAYGENEEAAIDVVTLTTKGKPLPNTPVTFQVLRREYNFIERQDSRGNWEYVFAPKDTELKSEQVQTDEKGMVTQHFVIPQGGDYRVVVKAVDGKGNAVQSATEIFAWGKGYVPWRITDVQKLELVPDKDAYKVGDTAKILVKSLVPVTKALFTLDRGRVLEYKIIDLGGNAGHLEIPITTGLIPNVYVSVIAQAGKADSHAPLVFYGETELKVEPDSKRLTVQVTPDRKGKGEDLPTYEPGDEVKVKIHTQDPQGKPVKSQVMVSVADESVLRLVAYQLPDLVEKFYYRRANSVESMSSMISLKAGDGGPTAGKKRRNFKDTADFQSYLETNDAGNAEFSFKLPDDLTTWVIEALAASQAMDAQNFNDELTTSDNHFVGGARVKIMSTKPVLVRTALPRFMVWGDHVQGRAIIANRTDKSVAGRLKLSVVGDAQLAQDKAEQELPFTAAAHSETTVPIDLKITFTNGHLTVSAEAVDSAGKPLDGLETNFLVHDRYMPEVVATSGVTRAAAIEKIALPADTMADRGGLDIGLRSSLAMAITPYLKGLIAYPYWCAEQKSSRLLALLMARQLSAVHGEAFYDRVVASDVRKKLDNVPGWDLKKKVLDGKIEDTIQDLADNYQNWDGGIRYWQEGEKPDAYLSGQVYWAWHLAKSLNYKVPDKAMQNLAKYLTTQLDRKSDDLYRPSPAVLSYILWAVSLDGGWTPSGVVDFTDGNEFPLYAQQLAYLTMAYVNHGDKKQAELFAQRLRNLAKQTPRKTTWDADWTFYMGGDAIKTSALAANALFELDHDDALVPRALASVLMQRRDREFVVTQDDVAVAWLIYNYSNTFKEGDTDFKAEVTADGTPLITTDFSAKDLLKRESRFMPLKDLLTLPMPATLKVAKVGEGSLYYDMVLKYYLPLDQTPPRSEGVVVTRQYYALSDTKEDQPLTEFVAGQNYKAHVTVVVPDRINYAVIQDQLPAGFEAIDMTLATSSKAAGLESGEDADVEAQWWNEYADQVVARDFGCNCRFSHQEIHDDMVLWSDDWIVPGVYHVRYPVRATTAGTYNSGFATAFAFYEPEIFGRSRGQIYTIREAAKLGQDTK